MELSQLSSQLRTRRPTLLGAQDRYAVLVPLVSCPDGLHLLYEVRDSSLRRQPGQTCFPGGRIESGESVIDCSLRETREELGLTTEDIELLGELDYLPHGKGILYPVLGYIRDGAAWHPGVGEVAETFTVPVHWLRTHPPAVYRYPLAPQVTDFPYADAGITPEYPWTPMEMTVPVYRGLSHPLWGVTARITDWLIREFFDAER